MCQTLCVREVNTSERDRVFFSEAVFWVTADVDVSEGVRFERLVLEMTEQEFH